MTSDPIPDDIRELVVKNIDSVAQLEALLFLRAHSGTGFDVGSLARHLFASEPVVEVALARLQRDSFVSQEGGLFRYDAPARKSRSLGGELSASSRSDYKSDPFQTERGEKFLRRLQIPQGIAMAIAIYSLCAITSLISSWLLSRAYWRTKSRLLLWSAISFAGLALNNLTLWVDKLVLPDTDLSVLRTSIALIAMVILLYGLVWETE